MVRPPPRLSMRSTTEDRLEWVHALVKATRRGLPGWLAHRLKRQPMLFIGSRISRLDRPVPAAYVEQWAAVGRAQAVLLRRLLNLVRSFAVEFLCDVLSYGATASSWIWNRPRLLRSCMHAGSGQVAARSRLRLPAVRPPAGRCRSLRRDARRSSSATCVRTRTLPGGCATRSPSSAGDVWLDDRRLQPGMHGEQRDIQDGIRRTIRLVRCESSRRIRSGRRKATFQRVERERSTDRAPSWGGRFIVPWLSTRTTTVTRVATGGFHVEFGSLQFRSRAWR